MIKTLSECFLKPKYYPEEAQKPVFMSQGDLVSLPLHYIQKGFLFQKPHHHHQPADVDKEVFFFLDRLKHSLSIALVHFYPLAGQLEIQVNEDDHSTLIFINPTKGPGAKFIHASSTDLSISDILISPSADVPKSIVYALFEHDKPVASYDGHNTPLLSVKVTYLVDGVFVACEANHACVDGTSYWHFLSAWSEIFRSNSDGGGGVSSISRPPVHERWFVDGTGPEIKVPFTRREEFVEPSHDETRTVVMRERFFHFSAASVAGIKTAANSEAGGGVGGGGGVVSSYQALSALVWTCVTKARERCRTRNDVAAKAARRRSCLRVTADVRRRLEPPLSEDYFGSSVQIIKVTCDATELVENGLGWAGWMLNGAVRRHDGEAVRRAVREWIESPCFHKVGHVVDPPTVLMTNSPRFEVYGCEFGMGKAVAVRGGAGNKFDGKVSAYGGRDEGGSVDLEICLSPDHMRALESDEEFVKWVS